MLFSLNSLTLYSAYSSSRGNLESRSYFLMRCPILVTLHLNYGTQSHASQQYLSSNKHRRKFDKHLLYKTIPNIKLFFIIASSVYKIKGTLIDIVV